MVNERCWIPRIRTQRIDALHYQTLTIPKVYAVVISGGSESFEPVLKDQMKRQ